MTKLLALAIVAVSVFVQCSHAPVAGGGTDTELGCTVTGMVYDEEGNTAPGVRVDLIPRTYNPVTDTPLSARFADTTDVDGRYRLDGIAAGGYTLVAQDEQPAKKMCIASLEVSDRRTDTVTGATLRPSGEIAIDMPDSISDTTGRYVFIEGTFFYAPAGRRVVLRGIPAGHVPPILTIDTSDGAVGVVAAGGVDLAPRGTVLVSAGNVWPYSARIYLNTSPTGAGISGGLSGFPVLIRLSSVNFSFSQEYRRGKSLIFTNANGAPLPHEVEAWDSANASAILWVKVDTIRGNDATQSILMYWGNADAGTASAAAVFDTADGFGGVWHLGEAAAGTMPDATPNGYNGQRNGTPATISGQIGKAQLFRGAGDFFEMGNVCNPGTSGFTVSAWVKPSTTTGYRAILSKSAGDSPSVDYGWLVELGSDGALAAFTANSDSSWGDEGTFVAASNTFIEDTVAWRHVVAVFNRIGNTGCKLYIDGAEVASRLSGDITTINSIVNAAPLRIGADAKGGCPWKGGIDECLFSNRVRSSDWIRLCYQNQRTDDKLIIFEKSK